MAESSIDSSPSNNDGERVVRCPAKYSDGRQCEKEVLSRSLHLHVLRKNDDAHGEQGDIPPNLDLKSADTVGRQHVEVNYPDERKSEGVARQCPYCDEVFRGKQGLEIHFGQIVGRKNHPKDRDEFPEATECPIVRVDDKGNITEVVDPGAVMPSTRDRTEGKRKEDETVHEFIERLRENGREDQAAEIEAALEELS